MCRLEFRLSYCLACRIEFGLSYCSYSCKLESGLHYCFLICRLECASALLVEFNLWLSYLSAGIWAALLLLFVELNVGCPIALSLGELIFFLLYL